MNHELLDVQAGFRKESDMTEQLNWTELSSESTECYSSVWWEHGLVFKGPEPKVIVNISKEWAGVNYVKRID